MIKTCEVNLKEIVITLDNKRNLTRLHKINGDLFYKEGANVIRTTNKESIKRLEGIVQIKTESVRKHFYEDAARCRDEEWKFIFELAGVKSEFTSSKKTEIVDDKYYALISINTGNPKTELE